MDYALFFKKQYDGEAKPLQRLRSRSFSCLHPVMTIGQVVKINYQNATPILGYKEHFLSKAPKATTGCINSNIKI